MLQAVGECPGVARLSFIVLTNVVASHPPECRPTGTPHACAKKLAVGGWVVVVVDTTENKVFCFGPRLELNWPKLNNNLYLLGGGGW